MGALLGVTERHDDGSIKALETLGPASACDAYKAHRPQPLRHVWHHVLPQVAGGTTTADNVVQVCDNCHICIHALLYALSQTVGDVRAPYFRLHGTSAQKAVAIRGYQAAVAAGTVDKIPNEGGYVGPR